MDSSSTAKPDASTKPGEEGSVSVQEQEILASIQELQRQLWEVKQEQEIEGDGAEVGATNGIAGIAAAAGAGAVSVKQGNKGGPTETLIIVSNRLPVKGKKDETTGKWSFTMSSGGLVTALMGTRDDMAFQWIGWLGVEVAEEEQATVRAQLLEEHNCVPVFLTDEMADLYYNGFSNDVLWPLFHYVPLPMYKAGAEKKFDDRMWHAYKDANRIFAEVVCGMCPGGREGDLRKQQGCYVWVQDYHLMRLPAELRARAPGVRIGWFLHTPFPSSEIYRILPVRDELLEGLASADLVGFHTYDYARHFLSACARVLEVETTPRGIEHRDHFMALGVYPIGIDPDHVSNKLAEPATVARIKELVETFKGRKILLGVDRLDYIKGMPHKLLGFELFLQRHPEWQGKVTLIQVGVPSRTEVPEYQSLANQVNQLVGRINGTYGTLEYNPVHYINQSVTQEELFAIYNLADVCVVTSVRDGMNLVCHEYVCAQKESDLIPREGPGVLILSEFAGSAQSLSGALRINPWNSEEVCESINTALGLSRVERELRQHKLYRYVTTHSAAYWAKSYMADFKEVCANKPHLSKLPKLQPGAVLGAYRAARNRLIICDYDGTLVQHQSLPHLAAPNLHVKSLLAQLAADPRNTVLVCSGREQRFLESWFGKLRVGLAAEYGFYYRLPPEPGQEWPTAAERRAWDARAAAAAEAGEPQPEGRPAGEWQCIADDVDLSWKDIVLPIMTYFKDRTPGTYIENKQSSLTWHYADADPHFGGWQAKDMQMHMEDVLSNLPLEILQSNRMVEVRHQCANKSHVVELALRHLAARREEAARSAAAAAELLPPEVDFVFCVGDDRSDEDMFQTVKRLKEAARVQSSKKGSTGDLEAASNKGQSAESFQEHADSNPDFWSNPSDPAAVGGPDGEAPAGGPDVGSGLGGSTGSGAALMAAGAAAYTVHLGAGRSAADHNLPDVAALRALLHQFLAASKESYSA